MVNSKHAFWQALIFAIVIFGIGLILGFFLESYRADQVQYNLVNSEVSLLDEQVRERLINDLNFDCELAKQSTFDFADNIYDEALKLESYDSASKFNSDSFLVLHRRYDLLRTLLWSQSIELKETCEEDFHTVVYLYNYRPEDIDTNSKQIFFSRLLLDLKLKYPDEIILIPIAVNNDLASVDLIVQSYELVDFPTVIIDEEKIVQDIITLEELENIVF